MNRTKLFFTFFLDGFESILNGLFPKIEDDSEAIRKDWENVGYYIRSSMNNFDLSNEGKSHIEPLQIDNL